MYLAQQEQEGRKDNDALVMDNEMLDLLDEYFKKSEKLIGLIKEQADSHIQSGVNNE